MLAVVSKRGLMGTKKAGALSSRPKKAAAIIPNVKTFSIGREKNGMNKKYFLSFNSNEEE